MNRYEVKVRTDKTFIIEAESREEVERVALEDVDKCRSHALVRSVIGIKNLTDDPIALLGELAARLEQFAFQNNFGVCGFCAGPRGKHAEDCIIECACYYIRKHERERENR